MRARAFQLERMHWRFRMQVERSALLGDFPRGPEVSMPPPIAPKMSIDEYDGMSWRAGLTIRTRLFLAIFLSADQLHPDQPPHAHRYTTSFHNQLSQLLLLRFRRRQYSEKLVLAISILLLFLCRPLPFYRHWSSWRERRRWARG